MKFNLSLLSTLIFPTPPLPSPPSATAPNFQLILPTLITNHLAISFHQFKLLPFFPPIYKAYSVPFPTISQIPHVVYLFYFT